MIQSKYVVVEVATTASTMTLVQYLITHGFDKFAVVSDLGDHPSLKYKGGTTPTPPPTNGKQRASINEIAFALSKKSSPPEQSNGFGSQSAVARSPASSSPMMASAGTHSVLTRLLDEKNRQNVEQKEQERQQLEIQRIILGQAGIDERNSPEDSFFPKREPEDEAEVRPASSDSALSDSAHSGHAPSDSTPSDEQVRASMIHLLNPALGAAFGFQSPIVECNSRKRGANGSESPAAPRKHRWMTSGDLEESRYGRGKNYGRVHCKATYKCALCGKPTTLNSTGSRWNLLRHVIMIHSESKPYQCFDCDFIGIKSNVISHARQSGHRNDDAVDVTTDEMRAEWNNTLHSCFPDYVKAKSRGWQSEQESTAKEEVPDMDTTDSGELIE